MDSKASSSSLSSLMKRKRTSSNGSLRNSHNSSQFYNSNTNSSHTESATRNQSQHQHHQHMQNQRQQQHQQQEEEEDTVMMTMERCSSQLHDEKNGTSSTSISKVVGSRRTPNRSTTNGDGNGNIIDSATKTMELLNWQDDGDGNDDDIDNNCGYTADCDDTTTSATVTTKASTTGTSLSRASSSLASSSTQSHGYKGRRDCSSSSSLSSSLSLSSSSTPSSSPSSTPFSSPMYNPIIEGQDIGPGTGTGVDDRKPLPVMTTAAVSSSSSSSSMSSSQQSKRYSLLDIGADVMANVLSFVDPSEALRLLTAPICTQWRASYTAHQDLWRTLCKAEPFCARLEGDEEEEQGMAKARSKKDDGSEYDSDSEDGEYDSDDDDSFCSLNGYNDSDDLNKDSESHDVLGEYRLMYTSFVRCMNYLNRIHDDAKKGRPLTGMNRNINSNFPTFGVTKGLKKFLTRSKEHEALKAAIGGNGSSPGPSSIPVGISVDRRDIPQLPPAQVCAMTKSQEANVAAADTATEKPKFGNSMITARLLGPSSVGAPSHLNLPKACAIYSIVNWMVAHPDVEGIQIMCVASLPTLLEDEQQRLTAQRLGLIEVVLSCMLRFPNSLRLHVAAFHTLVLLARPLGGREGMLFDNSMAQSTRGLGLSSKAGGSTNRLSNMGGMSILIESMNRFQDEERLQAMACWAMVNLALVPTQKSMLMSLDGVRAAVNALIKHPNSLDVQFRGLFALINLVVPCKDPEPFDGESGRTERDVLDESSPQIARLVVAAMETFCGSEQILNRACLVLHNLSQSPEYVPTLLWTPHLYQMLEWCITNHPNDNVLRRTAMSTLNRIQQYLSLHPGQRQRFVQSLAQNQLREAQHRENQERQEQQQAPPQAAGIVSPLA